MNNVLFIDASIIERSTAHEVDLLLDYAKDNVPFIKIVIMHNPDNKGVAELMCKDIDNIILCETLCINDIMDVSNWLHAKRSSDGIGAFAIVPDCNSATVFDDAYMNAVVKCDRENAGLTENKAKEAVWIMSNFGRDKHCNSKEKTFFVSDTHFFHANIIKYCNRPFADVDEMNAKLVENWNAVVAKDDIVWHLGDFAFGNKKNVLEIMPKLNGKINLVMGNHDLRNNQKFYLDAGFRHVYDRAVVWNNFFILSHEPLQWVSNDGVYANVFGHVHDSNIYMTFTARSACVCVERFGYRPVLWNDILAGMKKCEEPSNEQDK